MRGITDQLNAQVQSFRAVKLDMSLLPQDLNKEGPVQKKHWRKVVCSLSVWFWLFLVVDYDSCFLRHILPLPFCLAKFLWFPQFKHIGSSQHFWLGSVVFPTTRRGLPGYPFLPGRLCQFLKHRRTHTHFSNTSSHCIYNTHVLSIDVNDI